MNSETITRGSQGTLPRLRRPHLRALRRRTEHRSAAAAPPAVSAVVPAEQAAVQHTEPPEEFVWTPAMRVSVLAALVWVHHGKTNLSDREVVAINFHGINNAMRAGLVRDVPGDWQITDRGIEQLHKHDLIETYTATAIAV